MKFSHLFPSLAVIYLSSPSLASTLFIQDASKSTFSQLLVENSIVLAAFTSKDIDSLSVFNENFRAAAEAEDGAEIAKSKTSFVTIDCAQEGGEELCKKYDVNDYPTVRLFRRKENGSRDMEGEVEVEVERYRGKRTSEALHTFTLLSSLPPLTGPIPHSSLPSFKYLSPTSTVILAYLRPDQAQLVDTFRAAAERHHRDFAFGYTTDMASADAEGLAMPSVVCYRNIDGDNRVLNGHFGEEDLEGLVGMCGGEGVVGEFSERRVQEWMARDKLTVYIFVPLSSPLFSSPSTSPSTTNSLRHALTPLAKKLAQYVKFGLADAIEYGPMATNFGLKTSNWPALVVHAPLNDQVFLYKQDREITAEAVESMLMTILEGRATAGQVFGEEAPEKEGDDGDGDAGRRGMGSSGVAEEEGTSHDEL